MAVPEVECVIEASTKDRRRLTSVLRGTQYYNRLGGLRFVTRGPNENSSSGSDPERECRHDYDRQYSPNDFYDMFCFRSTRHPWKLR